MGNMLVLSTFQDNLRSDNGYLELTPSYLSTVTKLMLRNTHCSRYYCRKWNSIFIRFPFAAFWCNSISCSHPHQFVTHKKLGVRSAIMRIYKTFLHYSLLSHPSASIASFSLTLQPSLQARLKFSRTKDRMRTISSETVTQCFHLRRSPPSSAPYTSSPDQIGRGGTKRNDQMRIA